MIAVEEQLRWAGITNSAKIVEALEDGYISPRESSLLDTDVTAEEGLQFEQRRSWHNKIWMPQLPAGDIKLRYNVEIVDEIPEFGIFVSMENWKPFRPVFTIEVNGLAKTDSLMIMSGFNTTISRDVLIDANFKTDEEPIIPRNTIVMEYDIGERIDNARVLQINRLRDIRTEMMMFDVPQNATIAVSYTHLTLPTMIRV